jgi:outer membrane protein TolC
VTTGVAINGSQISSTRATSRAFPVSPSADIQIRFDASYEADVWRRIRHTVEAGVETAQATSADLENIRLSLRADLAANYFQFHGLDTEKELPDSIAVAYQKVLDLTVNRYNQGVSSRVDVVQAQTQLETTRAQATDTGLLAEAIRLAERSLALAVNRYQGGITTYLEGITTQSAALANERTGVELLTRRMIATVKLIKALDGGWDSSSLPTPQHLGSK